MSKSYNNAVALFEEKGIAKENHVDGRGLDAGGRCRRILRDQHSRALPVGGGAADVEKMEQDFRAGGIGYGDFKKRLFGALWEFFAPMRAPRELATTRPIGVLPTGRNARAPWRKTMRRVRTAVGLIILCRPYGSFCMKKGVFCHLTDCAEPL